MNSTGTTRAALCGLLTAVSLLLVGLTRDERSQVSPQLGGPDRYLTHLSTDKPIYRIGETVFLRGVMLHANTHKPLPEATTDAVVEIRGPKGDVVGGGWVRTEGSVLAFQWLVPDGQPGGEYTAKVSFPSAGYAPAERKFDVRAYRVPRLKSQIVFLRDGYGPGDRVTATLQVNRAEGGVPAGAKVIATARVDGDEVYRGETAVDAVGTCRVEFPLPTPIVRGLGTLTLVIADGGIVETAAKTIPILLQTLDLQTYPEGGDLVASVPARVYFEARTPWGKPADVEGEVLSAADQVVATFRSEHEGRGRLALTPRAGETYTLRITKPAGITQTIPLPAVKPTGAVLRCVDERTTAGRSVRLQVGCATVAHLAVTLAKREIVLARATADVQPGVLADVTLAPSDDADGVLIATVWDEDGKPLAERLVYREPVHALRISVEPSKKAAVPGDRVELTVCTTDDTGQPVGAVVGLTVTDDAVLEMIEKREQAPRLPVMVLLEPDVRELADAQVYLDPTNPQAPRAVDLLLGTQGWRRFAFVNPQAFVARAGDGARRVLALRVPGVGRGPRGGWAGGAPAGDEWQLDGDQAEILLLDGALAVDGLEHAAKKGAAARGEHELAERKLDAKDKRPAAEMDEDVPAAQRARLRGRGEAAFGPALGPGWGRRGQPFVVAIREYAHQVRPSRQPGDREDFAETLYWHAGLKTDGKTGVAKVSFGVSDSVTTFRVYADAFNTAGVLGQQVAAIESRAPFCLEPKLPLEVTAGDTVLLPVGVINGTDAALEGVTVSMDPVAGMPVGRLDPFVLPALARERRVIKLELGNRIGEHELVINGQAGAYRDRVTRRLLVKPAGFPAAVSFGGILNADSRVQHTLTIPAEMVLNSAKTQVVVYPTPLANLTQGLERLIREPNGCFEQTSSTTYPLTMAQQYFVAHTGVDPKLIERSRQMLDKGYAKLVSFECKQHGYEWFGGDPGHEALSAYGLLQFTDMAQVWNVDRTMMERTRAWLLAQRDGQGGFKRNKRALDSFGGAPEATTNAYVVWALQRVGEKDLGPEIAALQKLASETKDSYVIGLAANVLAGSGDMEAARRLMDRLVQAQTDKGLVDGAVTSITRSGGQALQIETTALSVLAWLKDPAYAGAVEKAMRFLTESCEGGRFGSTQSTVLALRAITEYDQARARPKAAGNVRLVVDGHAIGGPVEFDAGTQGAITLPDLGELLTPGAHQIELAMAGGAAMPYSIAVNYHALTPASSEECTLDLHVQLRDPQVAEGEATEVNVAVTNHTRHGLPTPVAIIGLPGGLEPRHDQLKELIKAGKIDAYEVLGREVVLYWREMKPGQVVELPLSVVAAVPGTYTGPASRTYLYYTDEFKTWTPGLTVGISPRN